MNNFNFKYIIMKYIFYKFPILYTHDAYFTTIIIKKKTK